MKPLNLDNSPCSPISSNCVIWQGPNLDCIKLCTGDTVSDVVAKLASELCTIMDELKVSNYDLSCFDLVNCKPDTFQALLQFLIEQICKLNNIQATQSSATVGGTKESTLVTVAPCFVVNGVTVMTLTDYVIAIGNKLCNLINEINDLQTQIDNINVQITNIQNQIDGISFTLPSINTGCLAGYMSGASSATIDLVLDTLLNDGTIGYCALIGSTGLPNDLLIAVATQCISSGDDSLQSIADGDSPVLTMTEKYANWIDTPITVADAITNIWISICDMYGYLINTPLSVVDTNTVNLEYNSGILSAVVQDTGWQNLNGFDLYMNNNPGTQYIYPQVRRIGNVLHFRGTVVIPLAESTGAVRPWISTTTENNYEQEPTTGAAVTLKSPYTGVGGVILSSFGSIQFYTNGSVAQSVIPTSVIPSGYALDGDYIHPARFQISNRVIQIGSNTSTILTTLLTITITSNGILSLGLVKNSEESIINGNNDAFDTSHLNYVISHVVSGESVPQFKTSTNIVHSLAGGGTSDLNLDFPAAYTYPFSCNANDEDDLGGFTLSLNGLTAFISPCGDLIPTPNPCL